MFVGSGSATVIMQVAVLFPSIVFTVIVAVPAATAVTLPLSSTVATLVLSEFQDTSLLAALEGETIADSVSLSPPPKKELTY